MDTDSEADCRATDNQSPPVVDDSSEEEWTYTPQQRSNDQQLTSEQRKTNVVVRLDFGEETRAEETKMIRVMSNDVNGNATLYNGDQDVNFQEEDEFAKDSEDEMMNNKECIRRLVSEAENLVREDMSSDGKPGKGTRIFPPLMFNQQGLNMASTRAKYARIKEWLKVNIILPNEGKSMSQVIWRLI